MVGPSPVARSGGGGGGFVGGGGGPGEHSGDRWIPTAKRPCGEKALNAKLKGCIHRAMIPCDWGVDTIKRNNVKPSHSGNAFSLRFKAIDGLESTEMCLIRFSTNI